MLHKGCPDSDFGQLTVASDKSEKFQSLGRSLSHLGQRKAEYMSALLFAEHW